MYAIGAAVLMWWINRALPLAHLVYAPWNRLGWAFVAVGFGADAYSAFAFFRAATTVNPIRISQTSALVINGIYRWSRNPMYCGLILMLIGWGVVLGSVAPLMVIVAFERIVLYFQVEPEESALEAKFGDSYRDYKRRVHRWIGCTRREGLLHP
jgi:protein-S-isoprenylcysteine O-methyltransferase Ste14